MTEGEEIISSALDILNLRCPQDILLKKVAGNSGLYIKVVGDINLGDFHTQVIIKTINEILKESSQQEKERFIGKIPWEIPHLKTSHNKGVERGERGLGKLE